MGRYKIAIITGASSGIGLAFAEKLASESCNLILISRYADKLKSIQSELTNRYKIDCHIIPCDLTLQDSIIQIIDYLNSNDLRPDLLINNAGSGIYGNHIMTSLSTETYIINLNVIALTTLTKLLINYDYEKNKLTILNVSSTLSFRKSPNWSVYAATKAYVNSYTRSLQYEMSKTNIQISLFIPGKTRTEFDKQAGAVQDFKSKSANPYEIVCYAYRKLLAGKKIIIPGFTNKLKYFMFKYFPNCITDMIIKML